VNDLDIVAIAEFALCVFAFRHDLAVDFHGNAALRIAGFGEQIVQRAAWRAGARLSIQDDRVHRISLVVPSPRRNSNAGKKQRPDMPGADVECNPSQ
jgi:hypothetical protein